jgi:hypothetical protein
MDKGHDSHVNPRSSSYVTALLLPWANKQPVTCGYPDAFLPCDVPAACAFPKHALLRAVALDVTASQTLALPPGAPHLLQLDDYLNQQLPPPLTFLHHQLTSTFNLHYHFPNPTNPPHIKMSAPNANNPNDGIVGQAVNSVKNAANYVSESIQGQSAEASKEANKQQAKGNVPGNDSITDRASGALSAAGDKIDQSKHDASAEANKRSV